jgi:hypothetical protein
MYNSVRVGGGGGRELEVFGPQQTDKHLPQSPFTGKFLDDDIFICFLESYLSRGPVILAILQKMEYLKVPKREIFDRSDFPNFYTIKSSWVGDLLVKILTYYFNF